MALSFTERAANRIHGTYLAERGCGMGIRIIAQPSECSGMAYRLVLSTSRSARCGIL